MAEDGAVHNRQRSTWHLLLQFVPNAGAGSEHHSVERVTEALGVLGLQPAEVSRIGKAVLEALQKAALQAERDQDHLAGLVRVWIPNVPAKDLVPSGLGSERADPQGRRGWGFFLLERQEGISQGTQVESRRVLELYLYQENAGQKGRQP